MLGEVDGDDVGATVLSQHAWKLVPSSIGQHRPSACVNIPPSVPPAYGGAAQAGSSLRLTPNVGGQAASCYHGVQVAVNAGFQTTFEFQILNDVFYPLASPDPEIAKERNAIVRRQTAELAALFPEEFLNDLENGGMPPSTS